MSKGWMHSGASAGGSHSLPHILYQRNSGIEIKRQHGLMAKPLMFEVCMNVFPPKNFFFLGRCSVKMKFTNRSSKY